jgi:prolyl oligopeptidase
LNFQHFKNIFLGSILCASLISGVARSAESIETEDPYLWLEEIQSARSKDWVAKENNKTITALKAVRTYDTSFKNAETAFAAQDSVFVPRLILSGQVYDFSANATHERGIWRMASVASVSANKPQWRTLFDLDAYAKKEGRDWVWGGTPECLKSRCLIKLSEGGKDAIVVREFDISTGAFVTDGFNLPESKTKVEWWDSDTLAIGMDFGPGSMTNGDYPRIIKLLKRGALLRDAKMIFEAPRESAEVTIYTTHEATRTDRAIYEDVAFGVSSKLFHYREDGSSILSPLPKTATMKGIKNGYVFAELKQDFKSGQHIFAEGSLIAYAIDPLLKTGATDFELVMPTPPRGAIIAINGVMFSNDKIYVSYMDNVGGRLTQITRDKGHWVRTPLAMPSLGSIDLIAANDIDGSVFATYSGLTTPTTLYRIETKGVAKVASGKPRFDSARFSVTQKLARSADGTSVPYFSVRPKNVKGPLKTLMFGYGGFGYSWTPRYVDPTTQLWLEQGNAFVLASLRGGNEFGDKWHRDAMREKRQNSVDDFHAVGEELIRSGQTPRDGLAITGVSHGGLLAATAFSQRPDLYKAVIIGVGLMDMKRYSKLLAGAWGIGEYGDPDIPADWAFISKLSPYHTLRADRIYPKPFIFTSTADDRVHPAHSRKFAARLSEMNKPYYFFESPNGGHQIDTPELTTLQISYLNEAMDKK